MTPTTASIMTLITAPIMTLITALAMCAGTGTVTPKSAKMLQPEEYPGAKGQLGDAAALAPDIFVAAPAVLDKVLIGVKKIFSELSGIKSAAVEAGLESGFAKFDSGDPTGGPKSACGLKPLIAKIAFGKVKQLLGGKVKVFITGSAPLGVEVRRDLRLLRPPPPPGFQPSRAPSWPLLSPNHQLDCCLRLAPLMSHPINSNPPNSTPLPSPALHRSKSLCRPSSAAPSARASA